MFYDLFKQLAEKRGVSVHKATMDIGLSKSTATKWKNTAATPQGDTLQRIADYFDVTVDYLLTGEETEKAADPKADGVTEDDIKVALFGGAEEVTDAMWDEVKRFADYVKDRESKKEK